MLELIDTLWNVNLADNIWVRKLKCELIDTLWNVNIFLDTHAFSAIIELIDTLWNVNLVETMIFLLCQRINRYIMECK